MNSYQKYKDSGIEWIGEIPAGWDVKKLKFLFDFVVGFTPPSGKNEYYENGEYIWITIADMKSKYLNGSEKKITYKAIEDLKPQIVPKNSLLYSFKLSVGKVAFLETESYTNEAIFSILPTENLNLEFYYYAMPLQIIHNANENIYGAKILNQELIKNAFLIAPPKHEQIKIANYLNQKTKEIDTLIEQKEQLLELYEEEKKAIINQAVTKGIDPNAKMKDSGIEWIGEISEGWEVASLKWMSKIYSGGTPDRKNDDYWFNGNIPWLNSGAVNQFIITKPSEYITEDGLKNSSAKWIDSNSLVVALAGQGKTKGMVALVTFPTTCNQSLAVVKPNNLINSKFLLFYLKRNYLHIRGLAGEGKRDGLNLEMIGSIPIPIVNLDEQQQIVAFIEEKLSFIDQKIEKTKKIITLYKEYKTALISEVVTGKIKVPEEL